MCLKFSNSIASHLGQSTEGAWGTLELTVFKGSNALDYFESLVLPLENAEEVMHGLLKLQKEDFVGRRLEDEPNDMQLKQEECWSSSLLTSLRLIQKRNGVMLRRSERVMLHVRVVFLLCLASRSTS
jgi:hypothetical protein